MILHSIWKQLTLPPKLQGHNAVVPHASLPRRKQALRAHALLRGLGETAADLAAGKSDVAQLAIRHLAQNGQVRLLLALGDDGGDRVVDGAGDAASKHPERSPNRKGRRRKLRSTVEQAHGRSSCSKRVKLPFPACTMHACDLQ